MDLPEKKQETEVVRPSRDDVKSVLENLSNSFWDFSSFARLLSRVTAAVAKELGFKDPEIDNRPIPPPEWLDDAGKEDH